MKKSNLPDSAVMSGASSAATPFNEKVTKTTTGDPGQWYKMDKGTPVGAATWARNLNNAIEGPDEPYEWAKDDTGERKPSKSGNRELTVFDIYVRYNPDGEE